MKHNSAGHGNGTRQGLWPRVNDLTTNKIEYIVYAGKHENEDKRTI